MGLFDETSSLVHLAKISQVKGHNRAGGQNGSTWVESYLRLILDSFGEGADGDTKRGLFVDKIRALKASKGQITRADIQQIRDQVAKKGVPGKKGVPVSKSEVSKKDPFVSKVKSKVSMSGIDTEGALVHLAGRLELSKLDADDRDLIIELSDRSSLDRSPKKNWVENSGELPAYVREIAHALMRDHGFTISHAIATAISRLKVFAATGEPATKAKAVAALAEWAALKAKNKARKVVK